MNDLIDGIFNSMLMSGVDPRLIVAIIAMLPIAEARIAIPIALKCGLTPLESLLYGFLGSSIPVPLLLVAFIPLVRKLASTKLFRKIGEALLNRVNGKAAAISGSKLKRMFGVGSFVAVPLPLTGVWTGSAVASVLDLGFFKSLISVIMGNLTASSLVLIITMLLHDYINLIMALFALIALIAAVVLLVKALKPKKPA